MLDYMIWPFFERYPSLTVLSKGLYRVNMDKFPKLVILIILVAFEKILKINLAHFRIYFLGEMEQWNDWRWRCQASLHNSWKSRHIYYVLFNRNTRLWYDTTLKILFLKKGREEQHINDAHTCDVTNVIKWYCLLLIEYYESMSRLKKMKHF